MLVFTSLNESLPVFHPLIGPEWTPPLIVTLFAFAGRFDGSAANGPALPGNLLVSNPGGVTGKALSLRFSGGSAGLFDMRPWR